ncbi:MAG: EMC3/TMCO1 family protein [Candidatus Micrarchaeota archaeon]
MDISLYLYFVTALSAVYIVLIRIIQSKLIDPNMTKNIQEKSKQINALYKEAMKSNNRHKMDEISKMNDALMPMMNAMLIGQVKLMVVILTIFFAFTWIINYTDPTLTDDFSLNLSKVSKISKDNGESDESNENNSSSDNVYSGSFILKNAEITSPGFWYVTVNAYNGGNEIAMNQTVFFIGQKISEPLWIQAKASEMPVHTNKEVYSLNDNVTVYANAPSNAHNVVATFNSGTRFYVDLPVTIPLINLRRIYDSQSWFIFSAVILGLLITPLVSLIKNFK